MPKVEWIEEIFLTQMMIGRNRVNHYIDDGRQFAGFNKLLRLE